MESTFSNAIPADECPEHQADSFIFPTADYRKIAHQMQQNNGGLYNNSPENPGLEIYQPESYHPTLMVQPHPSLCQDPESRDSAIGTSANTSPESPEPGTSKIKSQPRGKIRRAL